MPEGMLRHMVAAIGTIICLFAYLAGYYSAPHGWWWTAFAVFIIYGGIYRIVNK